MDIELLRPILSGLLGGILATWLMRKWRGLVPSAVDSNRAKELVAENRFGLLLARVTFFGVIAVGIYLFKSGYFRANDWEAFALIVGIAITVPCLALVLVAIGRGRSGVGEALVALAIADRTPLPIVLCVILVGIFALAIGVGAIL
ncbi:MAG TPA: hypothetical protein VJM11_19955 [Nevskiaceae bacterium]|nr:hypothetical protein [Nevskiaceae bacterium]